MKNSEAQTKQTNTEENHLFSFQYNNLMNLPLPNYLLLPNNLICVFLYVIFFLFINICLFLNRIYIILFHLLLSFMIIFLPI